jgi:hypothetical protein
VSALCLVSVTVGGLTLVEADVLPVRFDSRRARSADPARVVPAGAPAAVPHGAPPLAAIQEPATVTLRRIAEVPSPVTLAAASLDPPLIALPHVAAGPGLALPPAESAAIDVEPLVPGDLQPVVTMAAAPPPETPPASPELSHVVTEGSRSVSSAAGAVGVTLGRTSKDAGVATAGFFSRVARRVAGSF